MIQSAVSPDISTPSFGRAETREVGRLCSARTLADIWSKPRSGESVHGSEACLDIMLAAHLDAAED